MSDAQIVAAIEKEAGRGVGAVYEDGRCVELRLTDPESLYHGLFRRHSPAAKQAVAALVARLKGLRHLDLGKNRFGVLPDSFGELKELRELLLDSNALKTVPKWIK